MLVSTTCSAEVKSHFDFAYTDKEPTNSLADTKEPTNSLADTTLD